MLQPGSTLSLPLKALQPGVVTISPKFLGLERHIPAEHHVVCRPDVTHSASPDGPNPTDNDRQAASPLSCVHTAGDTTRYLQDSLITVETKSAQGSTCVSQIGI